MMSPSSMRTPLGRVRGLGSAKSGTEHFWLQRVTAVANIILSVVFIGTVIALVGKPYAAAMGILSHPLVAILMLLFVLSGVIHMRLGMQVVIEDYIHGEGAKLAAVMANTFFAIAVGAACTFAILKIAFGG
ncbi:MAG: succinate dehydrogenase, hydrophobic membrane anchor protein [Bosea sp. (in: a-proteobacteria)]